MTGVTVLRVYSFCCLTVIISCNSLYPLMAHSDSTATQLHSRQRRHTPLNTTKLCKAFGCKNGHCVESELRKYRIVCECFTGYKGTLCDRLQCPYSCGQHGTCVKTGLSLRCKCEPGYYGLACDKMATVQVSPNPAGRSKENVYPNLSGMIIPADSAFGNNQPIFKVNGIQGWFGSSMSSKLSDIKFSDFHSHAVIDTSVKPDVCAPGFQCYHGSCDREVLAAYGLFQCNCNRNYTGLFCEKKCTLKCQNGGRCLVLDDGHQLCECPFNFRGHYCEKSARTP